MFVKENVPPTLWAEAQNLQEKDFLEKIKGSQSSCAHDWKKVMHYDQNYSPYVDGRRIGAEVIKEFKCLLCNLSKPLEGRPYQTCWICGGKMKYDGREMIGQSEYAHIHKCEQCGHEYDTT